MTTSDRNLVAALRRKVYVGGHDPDESDPLHIEAANRIEQLLAEVRQLRREIEGLNTWGAIDL